jgi:hypothetical protein
MAASAKKEKRAHYLDQQQQMIYDTFNSESSIHFELYR